ncbi:Dirigent protein 19 [Capsicum annuum]|nr:Dirigent protein 19 [Capsicum annuum]
MTKFHFYFHDTVSGKDPSAIQIAQANITSLSPTSFGLVRMMDNPLTIGPNINSKVIGRAQGIYGFTSREERELLMNFNFVFTKGKYNGSTLSILGHSQVSHEYRELPVVGGSGVFRLARDKVADYSGKSEYPKTKVAKKKRPSLFPHRLRKAPEDVCFNKLFDTFKELHINLSPLDILQGIPKYAKYLKDVIMPKKLKDPGKFTLLIHIGKNEVDEKSE